MPVAPELYSGESKAMSARANAQRWSPNGRRGAKTRRDARTPAAAAAARSRAAEPGQSSSQSTARGAARSSEAQRSTTAALSLWCWPR